MQTIEAVLSISLSVLAACRSTGSTPIGRDATEADLSTEEGALALMLPGEQHAALAGQAGVWDAHYRLRWSPDAEWEELDGVIEAKSLLGGRWLMETQRFELGGEPFEGISLTGFSNLDGEYHSIWLDSMTTWWVESRGNSSAELAGVIDDPGGRRPFRVVRVDRSADEYETRMFSTLAPHGEVLMMSYVARRRR